MHACAVHSRGRWPVHSEWSVTLVCLGPLPSGSCPALFRGGQAAPRWFLQALREEGSAGALHACVHGLAEPRPRPALGRWTAQVAAQMDRRVASEQASGVWGEEGLGQARPRQARPPTCRQSPRWSRAEQVAMPWGRAGHPRPSAWPGPRGVTPSETAVPCRAGTCCAVSTGSQSSCWFLISAAQLPGAGVSGGRVRQGRAASPGGSLLICSYLASSSRSPVPPG